MAVPSSMIDSSSAMSSYSSVAAPSSSFGRGTDASRVMAQKLLMGWTLLGDTCTECHEVPLMKDKSSNMYCAGCDKSFPSPHRLSHGGGSPRRRSEGKIDSTASPSPGHSVSRNDEHTEQGAASSNLSASTSTKPSTHATLTANHSHRHKHSNSPTTGSPRRRSGSTLLGEFPLHEMPPTNTNNVDEIEKWALQIKERAGIDVGAWRTRLHKKHDNQSHRSSIKSVIAAGEEKDHNAPSLRSNMSHLEDCLLIKLRKYEQLLLDGTNDVYSDDGGKVKSSALKVALKRDKDVLSSIEKTLKVLSVVEDMKTRGSVLSPNRHLGKSLILDDEA